jgi:hypothetical protein
VPLNKTGSCGIIVTASRTYLIFRSEMSIPSNFIDPLKIGVILVKAFAKVDLPAPVRPTTPTFS